MGTSCSNCLVTDDDLHIEKNESRYNNQNIKKTNFYSSKENQDNIINKHENRVNNNFSNLAINISNDYDLPNSKIEQKRNNINNEEVISKNENNNSIKNIKENNESFEKLIIIMKKIIMKKIKRAK